MNISKKVTFNEYIWLFVIGCFLGFILETSWYFLKNSVLINKQGLLYGPFKPIYGIGLVLIVLIMNKFNKSKIWEQFIIGTLFGSLFEYFCSLFQEVVFGTSTWDYSNFNYNIAGRIYLPYCLAWGVITILCFNYFYPWFKKNYLKIPKKINKILTSIIAIFMTFNVILTTLATIRYAQRANDIETSRVIFQIIDKNYSDEYMQKKFPKLEIIK